MQDGQRNAERLASLTNWNTAQWKGQGASKKQYLEQQKDILSPRCLSQPMGYTASEYLILKNLKPCLQLHTLHGESDHKDSLEVI